MIFSSIWCRRGWFGCETFFAWLPYEPVVGFPLPSSALLCSKAVSKSAKAYTEDLKSRAHFWSNLDVPHVLRKILVWYFSSPYIQIICKKYQTIAEYHPLTRISLTVASGSIQLPCICIYPVHSKPFQTIQTFCWPLALHSTLIAHSFLGLRKSTEISSFRKFWCYFLCTHHLWLRESARVSGDAKAFPRFTFSEKCRTSDEIKKNSASAGSWIRRSIWLIWHMPIILVIYIYVYIYIYIYIQYFWYQ